MVINILCIPTHFPQKWPWTSSIKNKIDNFSLVQSPFLSGYFGLSTWHLKQGLILLKKIKQVISEYEIKNKFSSKLFADFHPPTYRSTISTM